MTPVPNDLQWHDNNKKSIMTKTLITQTNKKLAPINKTEKGRDARISVDIA